MPFPVKVHVTVPVTSPRTYRVHESAASMPHSEALERLSVRAQEVDGRLPAVAHTLLQALEAGLALTSCASEALAAVAEGTDEVFCPACFHRTCTPAAAASGMVGADVLPRARLRGVDLCAGCLDAALDLEVPSALALPMPRYRIPTSCWDTIGFRPLATTA